MPQPKPAQLSQQAAPPRCVSVSGLQRELVLHARQGGGEEVGLTSPTCSAPCSGYLEGCSDTYRGRVKRAAVSSGNYSGSVVGVKL